VRVLVVEDEQVLAEAIARGLRRQGMAVDLALDGAEALDKAAVNHYDVIVLDRDLPGCTATRSAAGSPPRAPARGS
jgi:DNA-binding response OmpR family regulator